MVNGDRSAALDATARRMRSAAEGELDRLMALPGEGVDEERSKALRRCAFVLEKAAQLLGEIEISDAKFMRLLNFKRVFGVVEKALEAYPEAMRAVADALERVGGGER
jgi:hypothetical protein